MPAAFSSLPRFRVARAAGLLPSSSLLPLFSQPCPWCSAPVCLLSPSALAQADAEHATSDATAAHLLALACGEKAPGTAGLSGAARHLASYVYRSHFPDLAERERIAGNALALLARVPDALQLAAPLLPLAALSLPDASCTGELGCSCPSCLPRADHLACLPPSRMAWSLACLPGLPGPAAHERALLLLAHLLPPDQTVLFLTAPQRVFLSALAVSGSPAAAGWLLACLLHAPATAYSHPQALESLGLALLALSPSERMAVLALAPAWSGTVHELLAAACDVHS